MKLDEARQELLWPDLRTKDILISQLAFSHLLLHAPAPKKKAISKYCMCTIFLFHRVSLCFLIFLVNWLSNIRYYIVIINSVLSF